MNSKQALKRLKQETTPTTYMVDFDKDECIEIIEKDLDRLEKLEKIIKTLEFLLDIRVSDFNWINLRELLELLIDDYKDTECIKEWLENE